MGSNRNGRQRNQQQKGQVRTWRVLAEDDGTGQRYLDRELVAGKLAELETIGENIGGAFIVGPIRERQPDGRYEVIGWNFEWHSYAPALEATGPPQPPPPDVVEQPSAEIELEAPVG